MVLFHYLYNIYIYGIRFYLIMLDEIGSLLSLSTLLNFKSFSAGSNSVMGVLVLIEEFFFLGPIFFC